ncbi:ATP-binding protein [Aquirhabdus parva]|uniref:ATP-binding protein n=1 Tax=Aquirhabdus parva TaxID=2283318 RepID=UPI0013B43BC6|nr:ATP-binding protein [Aquirhabdus parva]
MLKLQKMDIKFKLLDINDILICSNIDSHYQELVSTLTKPSEIFTINGKKVRAGTLKTAYGKIYAVTDVEDYIRSSNTFKTKISAVAETIEYLITLKEEVSDKVNSDTARLLHNLTSLNAHNIQEIYNLVSQDTLAITNSGPPQIDVVDNAIKKNTKACARSLLRIAKNNTAIKTEFSVFKKLYESAPQLSERKHNVHKVLMNTLYLFFPEFTDKTVNVDVQQSQLTAIFDYESVSVVLYHIIENSVKYILHNSQLNIKIHEDDIYVTIDFTMESLAIEENELELIFSEGYSGQFSKKTGKAGTGLGMNLVSRLINMNGGAIKIIPNYSSRKEYIGIPYQENRILVYLKKK